MAALEITTFIRCNRETVFNLARSIDLHIISTGKSNEKVIAGKTGGLIGLNETVTWQAYHLFKTRSFTSVITEFNAPFSFTDEMLKGDLKSFSHRHIFESRDGGTYMKDEISLEAPFGILGKLVMAVFLKKYFRKLLTERNRVIQEYAESGKANMILQNILH